MGIPVSDPENISTMKFLLAVLTLFAASACAYPQWGLRDKRSADAEPVPEANAQPEADAWYGYMAIPPPMDTADTMAFPTDITEDMADTTLASPEGERGLQIPNTQYQHQLASVTVVLVHLVGQVRLLVKMLKKTIKLDLGSSHSTF